MTGQSGSSHNKIALAALIAAILLLLAPYFMGHSKLEGPPSVGAPPVTYDSLPKGQPFLNQRTAPQEASPRGSGALTDLTGGPTSANEPRDSGASATKSTSLDEIEALLK